VKIVIGLGNPGKRYEHTPHNIGFAVIDKLASGVCVLRKSIRFSAQVGKFSINEEEVLLVKPQTYMNNSGAAVVRIVRYWKLNLSDVVVVLDDADLDLGSVRLRAKGGSGGHKGLESVISSIGSEDIARVRLGIGRPRVGASGQADDVGLTEYVLKSFSASEIRKAEKSVECAVEAVKCILESGIDASMNRFNRRASDSC